MTNVDTVINVDNIRCPEVPTPTKDWMLPNFGDEALDSCGLLADIFEAGTVAEFGAVNQIHVHAPQSGC